MGRPCNCCGKKFAFLVVVFIDESGDYEVQFEPFSQSRLERALKRWYTDLETLTLTEETVGKISYILVRPTLRPGFLERGIGYLKPPNVDFPEQMVQFYTDYDRSVDVSPTNVNIFAGITQYIVENNFSCIGVMIDDSGSTRVPQIQPGLNWWYDRISGKIVDDRIPILPDCESGFLSLERANGCVQQLQFRDERYLYWVATLSDLLFELGCNKNIEENEQQSE